MIRVEKRGQNSESKRHSAEQIVRKLREAEVELAKGARVKDACRKLGSPSTPSTGGDGSTAG